MRLGKKLIVLFFMLSIIGLSIEGFFIQTAHAQDKADFAYEMAQLTSKIVALPNNNVIKFKVTLDSEVDQTVAKLSPTLPTDQRPIFANEMTRVKNKIYADPKLNIEKSKADFSYDVAQITAAFMPKVESREVVVAKNTVSDKVPYSQAGIGAGKVTNEKAAPVQATSQQAKADFAAEMRQLAEKIGALPNNNVIKFKVTVDSEVDQTVANLSPTLLPDQRTAFGNDMAQIKNRIYSNPKLNIEKAKADFSNDLAKLTTKYMDTVDVNHVNATRQATGGATSLSSQTNVAGPKEPAAPQVTTKPAATPNAYAASPPAARVPKALTPDTYSGIMNDLMTVGDGKKSPINKVKIDGNIRYHYAVNHGYQSWAQNTSGLRARVGAEVWVNKDWRFNGMLEGEKSFLNYNDAVTFRLSTTGNIKGGTVQAGSFGYFMADGNIYDSTFVGGRVTFGGPVKYTFAFGNTDYTTQSFIATARQEALDYNLEAGVYNYKMNEDLQKQNTIVNLAGEYKFSNFSLGSMVLLASQKDSQGNNFGYVFGLNYGQLKTWRPGTYGIFARYYSQPRYTYISPSMNGRGGWMQGYRGLGIGVYYTLAENLVGGLEYYNLHEITTGEPGSTWWGSLTAFF